MTVSELIYALQQFDGNTPVVVRGLQNNYGDMDVVDDGDVALCAASLLWEDPIGAGPYKTIVHKKTVVITIASLADVEPR